MLKGFKDFLMRGNVIDLSIAVVMGAAFSSVVTAFTTKVVQPLLNAVTPPSSQGLGVPLTQGKPSTYIDISALITAALNFILVAAVVYFAIVLPMRTIQQRRQRGEESGPAEPTDIELLKEIRDLLKRQAGAAEADLTDRPAEAVSTRASAAHLVDGEPELFTQPKQPTSAPVDATSRVGPLPPVGHADETRPIAAADGKPPLLSGQPSTGEYSVGSVSGGWRQVSPIGGPSVGPVGGRPPVATGMGTPSHPNPPDMDIDGSGSSQHDWQPGPGREPHHPEHPSEGRHSTPHQPGG
ncbi:MAG TPA: large conductance mechanosensitive channel protein MscL [Pseudonocardia sp.]|jgi:large conductance mechanosensitive channel